MLTGNNNIHYHATQGAFHYLMGAGKHGNDSGHNLALEDDYPYRGADSFCLDRTKAVTHKSPVRVKVPSPTSLSLTLTASLAPMPSLRAEDAVIRHMIKSQVQSFCRTWLCQSCCHLEPRDVKHQRSR